MVTLSRLGLQAIALAWAWTGGLLIGAVFLMLASLFAILDLVSRAIGGDRVSPGVTVWVREWLSWEYNQNKFALTGGRKSDFDPTPPVPDL
ncbi:hypothetical protein [Natrinema ejinorense]|nr:hypothetical protein [Natrinema ejinorense]